MNVITNLLNPEVSMQLAIIQDPPPLRTLTTRDAVCLTTLLYKLTDVSLTCCSAGPLVHAATLTSMRMLNLWTFSVIYLFGFIIVMNNSFLLNF